MREIIEHRIVYSSDNKKNKRKKTPVRAVLYGACGVLSGCMLLITVLFSFIGRTVIVDGESMLPTLQHADRLFATETFYTPACGDIVIIQRPDKENELIVKRVVACGGDTVYIDFEANKIFVNGKETEIADGMEPIRVQGDVEFPLTVPTDCVFVLGDNRNASLDSRYAEIGCVSQDAVLGKAVLRWYPFQAAGLIK